MNLHQLRITIDNSFSREDLRVMCFDLNVDFDNLSGETKSEKIAALLNQFDRRGREAVLLDYLLKEKPEIEWTDLFAPGDDAEQSPFMGLQFYDAEDSRLFFGREQLTAEFVGQLRRQNTLVVVGASGSGKSSLVRAGIIPALKNNVALADGTFPPRDSTTWPVFVLTPGAQPLKQLAVTLTRESDAQATAVLMDDLARDSRSLDFFVSKLLVGQGKSRRLLLIVDQFEELFTLCKDETEQHAFVDNLMTAVSVDGSPLVLIIVLRADFYDRCARFPALHKALEQHQKIVGAMTADEIRLAVEQPARLFDYTFEPGLVDLILQDAGVVNGRSPDAGILPLLSHALLETWQRRAGRQMSFQGYAEAGRVQGAIAATAEARYREFNQEEQSTARRIFLRLADPGDNGAEPTRRLVNRAELFPGDEAQREQVTAVLERLADDRLITTDQPAPGEETVAVVHEALIRRWPRFLEWLQKNAAAVRLEHQLGDDARQWARHERDESFLYRGQRLSAVQQGLNAANLNVLEAEYIAASLEAEQASRRQKRLRALTLSSLVLFLISLIAVIILIPKDESVMVDIAYADETSETAHAYYHYDFVKYYDTFDYFAHAWLGNGDRDSELVWFWGSTDSPLPEGAITDSSGDFYYAFEELFDLKNKIDVGQNQLLLRVWDAEVQDWRSIVLNTLLTFPDFAQSHPGVVSIEMVTSEQTFPQIKSTQVILSGSGLKESILEIMNLRSMSSLNELKQGILLIQHSTIDANASQNTLILIGEGVTGPARPTKISRGSCEAALSGWGKFRCWLGFPQVERRIYVIN